MTVAIADPLIGSIIAGRYEVLRRIAKGGMGTIYEVRNTKLGRVFALKTITAEAAQDQEVITRFRREADVVAQLTHPHIVEVVDWDQLDDGSPILVMEYLRGETLAARLAATGPLPWTELARVVDQVLSALSVAHRAGVIHRDLKPDNIFLATDDAGEENVKLLDFGISKIKDSQTFATTDARMLGTPAYMAPEQAEGQHDLIGPATDVWAMGAIIYEMITGKVAFDAPSTPAILYRVCHGKPSPAAELRHDVTPQVLEILDWALDINLRLDDVDELRAQLRGALSTFPGVAWVEPMRSRMMDAASMRRSAPVIPQRASTDRPMRAQTPVPRLATQPAPAAPTIADPPRRRSLAIVGGIAAFLAAAAVVFLVLRTSRDDEPVAPAPVSEPLAAVQIPPVATAPAEPLTVPVKIESTPTGAEVFRMPSELKVGTTPWKSELDRANGVAVFLIKRRGYRDAKVEIDLRNGASVTEVLKAVAPPTIRKPAVPNPKPDRRKGEPYDPFKNKK
jgi:serine/threonine-protein kinase